MAKGKMYLTRDKKAIDKNWINIGVANIDVGRRNYVPITKLKIDLSVLSDVYNSDWNDDLRSISSILAQGYNLVGVTGAKIGGLLYICCAGGEGVDPDEYLEELLDKDPNFKFTKENVGDHVFVHNEDVSCADGFDVYVLPPNAKVSTFSTSLSLTDAEVNDVVKDFNADLNMLRKRRTKSKTAEGQIIKQIKDLQAALAKIK